MIDQLPMTAGAMQTFLGAAVLKSLIAFANKATGIMNVMLAMGGPTWFKLTAGTGSGVSAGYYSGTAGTLTPTTFKGRTLLALYETSGPSSL
jgi:hypothetical protein